MYMTKQVLNENSKLFPMLPNNLFTNMSHQQTLNITNFAMLFKSLNHYNYVTRKMGRDETSFGFNKGYEMTHYSSKKRM